MKRTPVWIAWAVCVVIGVPAAAFAQGEPRASLAAGYVYLFQRTAGDLGTPTYPAGWLGTGALRLGSGRWSAVGEFGISDKLGDGADGLRVELKKRLRSGGARLCIGG